MHELQNIMIYIGHIMTFCHDYPEQMNKAIDGLTRIMNEFSAVNKPEVRETIAKHITEKERSGVSISKRTYHYRLIAERLAKTHHIQLSQSTCRKKEDIIEWLELHWNVVKDEFFILLDNIGDVLADADRARDEEERRLRPERT
jgi:hypothetical protein